MSSGGNRGRVCELQPDACLINRYAPGAKLSLHQDKDEPDLRAPIVSVSLGVPAVFQFGGLCRSDPIQRILLEHGDIVVWGGESRLFYHGIQPLKAGFHPMTGEFRYNLTFRQAAEKNKNKIIIAVQVELVKLRAVIIGQVVCMELLILVWRQYRWPFISVMALSLASAALGISPDRVYQSAPD